MNSIERTNAAMRMKQYDYVSPQPQIDVAYAAKLADIPVGYAFIDEDKHAQALNNVFENHDVDGVYVNLCLSKKAIVNQKEKNETISVYDDCGATWKIGIDDIGAVQKREITSLDDERLFTLNPDIFGAIDVFKKINSKWKEEKAIVTGVTGAFSHLVFLYGVENTMMDMILEPEKVKKVIEARCKFALEKIDQLADLGCKYMWIGEGAASGSLISPKYYKEFVLPYQKRMTEHMKKRGILSVVHICGDINQALPDVATSGADAIDLDYMNDLKRAKDIIGGRMCIKGNFSPMDLQKYTTDEVIREGKEKIALFEENKGLILSTGCLVTRDTPKDNIDAFVEVCKMK